jgi:hypothetical protein
MPWQSAAIGQIASFLNDCEAPSRIDLSMVVRDKIGDEFHEPATRHYDVCFPLHEARNLRGEKACDESGYTQRHRSDRLSASQGAAWRWRCDVFSRIATIIQAEQEDPAFVQLRVVVREREPRFKNNARKQPEAVILKIRVGGAPSPRGEQAAARDLCADAVGEQDFALELPRLTSGEVRRVWGKESSADGLDIDAASGRSAQRKNSRPGAPGGRRRNSSGRAGQGRVSDYLSTISDTRDVSASRKSSYDRLSVSSTVLGRHMAAARVPGLSQLLCLGSKPGAGAGVGGAVGK